MEKLSRNSIIALEEIVRQLREDDFAFKLLLIMETIRLLFGTDHTREYLPIASLFTPLMKKNFWRVYLQVSFLQIMEATIAAKFQCQKPPALAKVF